MKLDLNAGPLSGATRPVQEFWTARDARERRLLTIGGLAVLLALVYMILLAPAINGRDQLRKALPGLHQQLSQVQAMANEVGKQPRSGERSTTPVTREALEGSLNAAGLRAQSISVSENIIRLQLNGVSFGSLTGWLEKERSLGITVLESSIVAQTQPGTVNATLTLRQQGRE
jgi:general secretion pathway protein M